MREQAHVLALLDTTGKAIASKLDLQKVLQTVTDTATQLSGAQFGAFFYNVTNDQGESFLLYTLSGAPREAFEKFGLPRNTPIFSPTFTGEGVVRSARHHPAIRATARWRRITACRRAICRCAAIWRCR